MSEWEWRVDSANLSEEDRERGDRMVYMWYKNMISKSSFDYKLMSAIFQADMSNRRKLAKAFPEIVLAVNNYNMTVGYTDRIVKQFEVYEGEKNAD